MENRDRKVREQAFRKLYHVYDAHKNMLAETFSANLRQAQFFAGMRKYGSSLEAALDQGNIPVSVYDNLIEAVHEKLPAMYEYMGMRKKLLHLEELHLYDVYVPLVERPEQEIPFEEAKRLSGKVFRAGRGLHFLLDKDFRRAGLTSMKTRENAAAPIPGAHTGRIPMYS